MKKLLLAAVALAGLSFGQAHAVLITITGTSTPNINGDWEVTTIFDSFLGSQILLEAQVWFGDAVNAVIFATAVGNSLGLPNVGNEGPFFAYGFGGESTDFAACVNASCSSGFSVPWSSPVHYAIADPVLGVPEPGTLVLLAVGLFGLGFARRRRALPIQLVSP